MKQKIRQIIYDIRRQPLISGVTFFATALSVFLFMIVAITARVKTVPFSPESCRDQLLIGKYIHVERGGGSLSGSMSYTAAQKLYADLDGIEQISYFSDSRDRKMVSGENGKHFNALTRNVDANFFKIFDHELVAGRYFTKEEADACLPVAVVSESTARRTFGTTDCVGRNISVEHKKYKVTGVIKDHSLLATTASGDIFTPFVHNEEPTEGPDVFGGTTVALLAKKDADFQNIRKQVESRYSIIDTELKPDSMNAVYHGSPYDQETIAEGQIYSNVSPDTGSGKRMRYLIYAILILVPAINLGSMFQSRMRHRVSEIGVRRAYGCTRLRIIYDIIAENFIITLIGGIAGVALGMIFALTYSGLYETGATIGANVTPAFSSVINLGTLAIAVGMCFILNLISASLPAWKASRINIVEAINDK